MMMAQLPQAHLRWTGQLALFLVFFLSLAEGLSGGKSPPLVVQQTSLVTGANGYVGRAVVHSLLESSSSGKDIVCLVRAKRVAEEKEYWEKQNHATNGTPFTVRVLSYDMLDGGTSLKAALESTKGPRCVYHVASVFGPTDDHKQTALDNVQGTEELIRAIAAVDKTCKLVLTSSMAAVRGPGQVPSNSKHYTSDDWNTGSVLGANWGASYQWSKAESERRAWELCKELGIPMVSLCPSFIFGPPNSDSSVSYSLTLVKEWIHGKSSVQSRLFVDVRDVAQAHVAAGTLPQAVGQRFIASTEARVSSQEIAGWFQSVCRETELADPEKIHFDADFQGGYIPIGQREVEASDRLRDELGVTLRSVKSTMMDMADVLLKR
jgi:nucleoside-diphosphate-sugar epimerase